MPYSSEDSQQSLMVMVTSNVRESADTAEITTSFTCLRFARDLWRFTNVLLLID